MYNMIELKYNYKDLEPYYNEETLKLHYDVLYKNYVEKTNKTLTALNDARNKGDYSNIRSLEKDLSFNMAGAVLHSLFFNNLTPTKTSMSNELLNKINEDFGTQQQFKAQFFNNILNIQGPGWGILGYSNKLNKLIILQAEKHQDLTVWDFIPLLVIDIWEHSYYLQYKTNKIEYMNNIWNIIDFTEVSNRYNQVTQ